MITVNIHEAKTHLSRLIQQAVKGEPFIIAKSGKPLVKVSKIDENSNSHKKRLGFMRGQISVPEDFEHMYSDEIENLFEGKI